MTEVYLAIYDLSQGMARSLSAQFLGPNHEIEMIPHTALLVFGKEYFFGGGIQSVDPHYFRTMTGRSPVRTEKLGMTHAAQSDFDAWCRHTGSIKYNVSTYDLLHCNCNHFSNDAALQGLGLPKGVPSWILEVPQRFLASPMGQMMRPMLEQMQITQTSPVQAPPPMVVPPLQVAAVQVPAARLSLSGTAATFATSAASPNPWATMSSSHPVTAASKSRPITPPLSTPESILKKYTKPMLSTDTKSVSLCVSKLYPYLNTTAQHALEYICKKLQEQPSCSPTTNSTQQSVDVVVPELWKLVQEGKVVSFALLILRLVVLRFTISKAIETFMSEIQQALSDNSSNSQLFSAPASRSLAWCVASNFATHCQSPPTPSFLLEAAVRDWNHDTVQVRQAACTFLYNFVICNGPRLDHDEETVVSLVCSSLESLVEETDPTTRLRRLLVGARVVFGVHYTTTTTATTDNSIKVIHTRNSHNNHDQSSHAHKETRALTHSIEHAGCNEMAKDLIQDLGFVSLLQELAMADYEDSRMTHPDTIECQHLALELMDEFQY